MSLRILFCLVAFSLFAAPSQVFSQDEADAADATDSATDSARERDRSPSPVSRMFSSLDTNGDRRLTGEEVQRLPASLKAHFAKGREVESVVITFEQFNDRIEELKKGTAERFQRDRVESDRVGDQRDRTRYAPRDTPVVQADAKPAAANDQPVRRVRQLVVKPEVVPAKAFKVEIVMLRRTSDALPSRTLASEVSSVLDGAGPSLSARILPWLADPDSRGASLVDLIQAQSAYGESILVQRGGSEPYVSGTTSMGSRGRAVSYNMQQVGTMVRVESATIKDSDKLGLSVQFEKSYLEQATADDDEDDEDDAAEESTEPAGGDDAETEGSSNTSPGISARSSRSTSPFARTPVSEPVPPPTIATITAQGKLVLPAGEAGILTEIAKQSGDTFEEVVILVQWN